jgi:two-component system sensor histidine kinase SenX3
VNSKLSCPIGLDHQPISTYSLIVLALEILAAVVLVIVLLAMIRHKLTKNKAASNQESEFDLRVKALSAVVEFLPGAAMIVNDEDQVIAFNSTCVPLRLISNERIAIAEIRQLNKTAQFTRQTEFIDQLFISTDATVPDWEASVQISPIDETLALLLITDLSEERRLNEVRRDFVANVSHELKTPVGALSLLAEAISAAGSDSEKINKFSARMQLEVQRLTELISDLVELSEVQGDRPMHNFVPVSISSVIQEAADIAKLMAVEQKITVNVAENNEPIFVLGDQRQLVTALSNLITNAIRYSPEHTNVGVGARVIDNQVEISVTDQGPGISEADQIRIFERFYRVDPARSRETGGTGLGLSIVKYICANHGGECTVWSRIDHGSTFTLRIPVYSAEAYGKVNK